RRHRRVCRTAPGPQYLPQGPRHTLLPLVVAPGRSLRPPAAAAPEAALKADSQAPPLLFILLKTMPANEVIVPLTLKPAPRDTFARPMRDLRISVMDRCNFRCPYCMPRETFHEKYRFLGSHERLSFDEIVRLVRLFV